LLDFLLWEDTEMNGDIFGEFCFHDIFSDTRKLSVVKKANLHDALSNCCLSLFVAVNTLEQS
jgi:hypothetical protein